MPVLALITDSHPDKITLESDYSHKDTVKSLLASAWDSKTKVWRLPLSWTSCLVLRAAFGSDLQIHPTLRDWATREKAGRIDPALGLQDAIGLAAAEISLAPIVSTVETLGHELTLYSHQSAGAAFMAVTESCLIADEQGTGKSCQAISALRAMERAGKDVFPILVVAPNSVKTPWAREFEQWWPGLKVTVVEGSLEKRRKQLAEPAHVYIMNWEQLMRHSKLASYGGKERKRCVPCGGLDDTIVEAKCEVHEKELNFISFQTVIGDEIHRAAHGASMSTRSLWAVADNTTYRFALTGTPVQDKIDGLWAILRFLYPKDFPSKTRFIDRYAEQEYTSWGIREIIGLKMETRAEFHTILKPIMRRMLKKVVLPFLPPIVTEKRYVQMSGAQLKAYRDMSARMLVDLEDETLVADSPLTQSTRLLQFASSYGEIVKADPIKLPEDGTFSWETLSSDEPDSTADDIAGKLRLALPSNKIAAFLGDVKAGDFGDSSIVVFAQSRQLIEMLSKEMDKAEIQHGLITGAQSPTERQEAIDDFQARKIKYVLVTLAAGGTGLTLTAADTMVFLQRSFSSIMMSQSYARAHRLGSEIHESITVLHYITEKSIEEFQMDALDGKYGRIEEIMRDRELLKKYL